MIVDNRITVSSEILKLLKEINVLETASNQGILSHFFQVNNLFAVIMVNGIIDSLVLLGLFFVLLFPVAPDASIFCRIYDLHLMNNSNGQ